MNKTYASAKILFEEAQKEEMHPTWMTRDGLFSVESDGEKKYVYYTKLHINSQLGAAWSQNKYLTRIILDEYKFQNIPYCYSKDKKNIQTFFDTYAPIIQKPILGQKAEDVHLIINKTHIRYKNVDETIFEQFIDGTEHRCLLLQNEVIAMQRKTLDSTPKYPWRKKIENIEKSAWNKPMVSVSKQVSKIFHLGFIAVDFIVDREGKLWLLEVNSMPGLFSFHNPDVGGKVNVAALLLQVIQETA